MTRPTQVNVNSLALQHNLQQVRRFAPTSSVLAMIKANAYGHGLERVALALSKADAFGVACLEEGLQLRAAGVIQPIVLLEGLYHADELPAAMTGDFSLVVHH